MLTFDDVRAYLRERFKLGVDEPRRIELGWRIHGGAAPVLQREIVEPVTAFGVPHILIAAEVMAANALSPVEAVAHNARLAVGSLALVGDMYWMRAVLAIDGTSTAVLDRALELVAHEAARLRAMRMAVIVPAPYVVA